MRLKKITAMFAAVLFAFVVVACSNNDPDPTPVPAESPAASEAAA